MKTTVEQLLQQSIRSLGILPVSWDAEAKRAVKIDVYYPKDKRHGDLATNLPLMLAQHGKLPAQQLAKRIVQACVPHPDIERVEIAEPGFINFFIRAEARYRVIAQLSNESVGWALTQQNPVLDPGPIYAYRRTIGIFKQLAAQGLSFDEALGLRSLDRLQMPEEHALIDFLSRFPDVADASIINDDDRAMLFYLDELAKRLHSYYNAVTLWCKDEVLRSARLCLLQAVKQALHLLSSSDVSK